jgi:alpha-tubulin suppressor-like RCC1 family protein
VRFTPAALPAALASLQLTSDSATPVADVTLRGEGAGAAQLSVSSNSLHFGTVATHTTERRQILVSNPGNLPLHFTAAPAVSGAAAFAAGQTNCGAVLAAGASCAMEVSFGSATPGTFAGALTIEAAAAQSPQTVALSGTAFNPVSLGAATLPEGRLGRAFGPFDFRTLLSVSNESTPDLTLASWQVTAGALPAGLSLDAATGVLSGTPTQLTAGQDFTVAATYRNNQGQQVFTIRVGEGLLQAVQVEAGEGHTCALTPAGAVMCWGANGAGQLGDGTTTSRRTPVQVVGLSSGVVRISAHSGHTCALTNAGAMLCWGDNSRGQLGDGTTTNRSAPTHPAGLSSGVADISAGFWQTCAVTTGGQGLCWGDGNMAEIPAGATSRRLPYPVVGLGADVASISAGWYRACAVTVAGRALCWGWNDRGQLGDGTLTARHTATQVFGLSSGVASISAGTGPTCAVTTTGRALCWGTNIEGAVGDGTTADRRWPTQVSGLTEGVVGISAGAHHVCATVSGGQLLCWGRNSFGHLGDGTLVNRPIPTQVLGAESGFAGVSAGGSHTCASTSAGTLRCWGGNFSGELGDGTTTNRTTPVPVSD